MDIFACGSKNAVYNVFVLIVRTVSVLLNVKIEKKSGG
jgi:hypothetical protein